MNWSWEQQLGPVPKLVLMALADNADDHGYCWPKLRTIASKCCVSERTVQRTIKELRDSGLLSKNARYDHTGRQVSNGYTLQISGPDKLPPSSRQHESMGDKDAAPRVTELCRGKGDIAMSTLEPPHIHQNESSAPDPRNLSFLPTQERRDISLMLQALPEQHRIRISSILANAVLARTIKNSPAKWLRAVIRRELSESSGEVLSSENDKESYARDMVARGLLIEDALLIAQKTRFNQPRASASDLAPQVTMKTGRMRSSPRLDSEKTISLTFEGRSNE